jgi:hypothetical protein
MSNIIEQHELIDQSEQLLMIADLATALAEIPLEDRTTRRDGHSHQRSHRDTGEVANDSKKNTPRNHAETWNGYPSEEAHRNFVRRVGNGEHVFPAVVLRLSATSR